MPTIPTYDGNKVRDAALQPVYRSTPDVSSGTRAIGQGLGQLGEGLDQLGERQAQTDAQAAEADLRARWYEADAKFRNDYRGAGIDGYRPATEKWWNDEREKLTASLSPRARALADKSLASFRVQETRSGLSFVEREREGNLDRAYAANTVLTVQGAVRDATPENAQVQGAAAAAALDTAVAQQAAVKGWDTDTVRAEQIRQKSALHETMVQNLMVASPSAAEAYLKANKDSVDQKTYARLESQLKGAADAQVAIDAADAIIAAAGGFADGKPVETDKLEQAARDKFKGDPTKSAATINELRQRVQAFNAAEGERVASRVSTVMAAAERGAGLNSLRKMPEFQALPGDRQAAISQSVIARQQSVSGLALTELQRQQSMLALKGYSKYYELVADPARLAAMSTDQIRAMLPELGNAHVGNLLEAKRALEKPQGVLSAQIDTDDFNVLADQMGLRPYETDKSENDKARLGALKSHLESAVAAEQQRLKRALTRDEKKALYATEMANTVKVKGGWFGLGSPTVLPVGAVTAKDAANLDPESVAAAKARAGLPRVTTQAQFDALRSGDKYIGSDGKTRTKP